MKIRKKTYSVLAMKVRTPKIDVVNNSVVLDRFDLDDVVEFFNHIKNLNDPSQNLGDRFIFLEQFNDNYHDEFYSGWFISARYGESPNWIDSNTLVRRPNDKKTSEGEENRTYFVLEKKTGLFLLQSDNKRIATGKAVDEYLRSKIETFGDYIREYNRLRQGSLMTSKEIFIQLDYSINTTFMKEVNLLARIKKTTIQCDITKVDENPVVDAISNHLEGVEGYDEIEFSVVNKQRKMGIGSIEKFMEDLYDRQLYRNIIVTGTTSFGRPKTISWGNHAKKYEVKAQINSNGLVYQDDIINQLIQLGLRENPLRE